MKNGASQRDWVVVALYVVIILAAVPFVRAMQLLVKKTVGSQVFAAGTILLIVLASIAAAVVASRKLGRLRWTSVVWAVLLVAVAATWSLRLWEPEEAVHLVEYGTLGVLLYRALRHHFDDATVLVAAAILGALVGTVDELVQWLTPGRFFDYRDIGLNLGASLLTQAGLWLVAGVAEAHRRPKLEAIWRLTPVLIAWVLLIGFCLSATPQRCQKLVTLFPGLAFISDPDDVVSEYGYRHEVDHIGVFRSRFSLEELVQIDLDRGPEVAAVLDAYKPHKKYRSFLNTYPSGRAPFVHEARVHVFSRNANTTRGRKDEGGRASEHFTVAHRENLILEGYFSHSLAASTSAVDPGWKQQLLRRNDSSAAFESRVSAHLITRFTESQMRLVVAALLIVLLSFRWFFRS